MTRSAIRGARRVAFGIAAAIAMGTAMVGCQSGKGVRFRVIVPKARRSAAVDGRVIVLLAKNAKGEPRLEMREPRMQMGRGKVDQSFQMFGVDVDQLAPDSAAVVEGDAIGFPAESLADVEPGEYTVQAVLNVYETFKRHDGHTVKLSMDHWEG